MTVIEALLYTVWLLSALLRLVLTLFSAVRPLTALLRPLPDLLPQSSYRSTQSTAAADLLWPLSDPTAGYACEK